MTANHPDLKQIYASRNPVRPRHCDVAGIKCTKLGSPGDLECLCCILGEIRAELALIRESLEERK